jgi:hypothetical protein
VKNVDRTRFIARSGQGREIKLAVLAVTFVTLLVPAVNCSEAFAQSSDWKPGDPINLGHVHKSDAGGDQSNTADGAIQAENGFLKGGVEHSEEMAPTQSGLKVGAQFDEANLEKPSASRAWYRVPPWLAGKWQCDEQFRTSYTDYKTGTTDGKPMRTQVHSDVTYGIQRDRLGGIWDCIDMPQFRQVSSDKWLNKDLHTGDSVIFDSDSQFIMRFVCTRTTVDKTTNTINSVFQFEQFSSYLQNGQDTVKVEASMKNFDQAGKPVNLTNAWKIEHRVTPFIANNYSQNNQDVRPSFREYLKSNGMDNLIPLEQ